MYVKVGNEAAIEGVHDPETGKTVYRDLPGQRITEIVFPEGIEIQEAFVNTIGALRHHMKPHAKPTWIDTDSDALKAMLKEHFDLPAKVMKKAPKTWGK